MSYFSRLTDIVTCNLTQILNEATDPRTAIAEIITEMQEGLAGAQRSVNTANSSEQRLKREIDEHRRSIESWTSKAREQLSAGSEQEARQSLMRKREIEDLIAGLEQQHRAAISTRQNLATMQRALEARLSEALRKREDLGGSAESAPLASTARFSVPAPTVVDDRQNQIDAELEALKRELGT
ncbi:MAG: PspA/IM30 family protein [Planctomycetes bacterium]|nr:PspA/IM30 family protein [Planctomycetota bacterium]